MYVHWYTCNEIWSVCEIESCFLPFISTCSFVHSLSISLHSLPKIGYSWERCKLPSRPEIEFLTSQYGEAWQVVTATVTANRQVSNSYVDCTDPPWRLLVGLYGIRSIVINLSFRIFVFTCEAFRKKTSV